MLALRGEVKEVFLDPEGALFGGSGALITAVGLHEVGVDIVLQITLEDVLPQIAGMLRVGYGEHHLDPVIQVARHQVGAAQVDLVMTIVEKIVDAAVLKEAAHDADHADIPAEPLHPGDQAADAADEQVHFHAGLGGLV